MRQSLTLDHVKGMTISIYAYNTDSGVERVMISSTIETMAVTVSGGQITSVSLTGRVQTNGGRLDPYTKTITF